LYVPAAIGKQNSLSPRYGSAGHVTTNSNLSHEERSRFKLRLLPAAYEERYTSLIISALQLKHVTHANHTSGRSAYRLLQRITWLYLHKSSPNCNIRFTYGLCQYVIHCTLNPGTDIFHSSRRARKISS